MANLSQERSRITLEKVKLIFRDSFSDNNNRINNKGLWVINLKYYMIICNYDCQIIIMKIFSSVKGRKLWRATIAHILKGHGI